MRIRQEGGVGANPPEPGHRPIEVTFPTDGRPTRGARPRSTSWNGRAARERTCGCSPQYLRRFLAIQDVCHDGGGDSSPPGPTSWTAARAGRPSGVHQWPVLGVHDGPKYAAVQQ